MSDRVVVNVAAGAQYPRGQARLRQSLTDKGFGGDLLFFGDNCPEKWPPKAPPHAHQPYAFKIYALREAKTRGHRFALWCDSSIWFCKSPAVVFDRIERDGYYWTSEGWNTGQWTSEDALPKLGVTREEAFGIEMIAAKFFGLDLSRPETDELLSWMMKRTTDGSLRGPWRYPRKDETLAPQPGEVLGHRHDQSAFSVIVHKLGMKVSPHGDLFECYHTATGPTTVALAGGM